MANSRFQLTQDCYMPLDGQWRIVQCGTVFDDVSTKVYAGAIVLGEAAASLAPHGKPTPVRNVRTR